MMFDGFSSLFNLALGGLVCIPNLIYLKYNITSELQSNQLNKGVLNCKQSHLIGTKYSLSSLTRPYFLLFIPFFFILLLDSK